LNPRPLGYEPNELPDCSTPRHLAQSLTISHRLSGRMGKMRRIRRMAKMRGIGERGESGEDRADA
jgi:hypothetical protein